MSMLPEAKLDILLAHHASLEAQLLGQVNSENYVRITRELAELNPLIERGEGLPRRYQGDRRYRRADLGSRDRSRHARHGGGRARNACRPQPRAGAADPRGAVAQGRHGRPQRRAGNPRRYRRRRGRVVRRRPVPDVRALRQPAGLEDRGDLRQRRHHGRLQGNHRRGEGPRRLRQIEVRIGCTACSACPIPRRRAAFTPRRRRSPCCRKSRRSTSISRTTIFGSRPCARRRRRPARQQDRVRDPDHPYSDRYRGSDAGQTLAAQEPAPRR